MFTVALSVTAHPGNNPSVHQQVNEQYMVTFIQRSTTQPKNNEILLHATTLISL